MGKKILYSGLSLGFFVILLVAIVMFTNTFFNSSSSFFDRFSDIENIYKGIVG